jgi:hypothetical protein
VANTLLIRTHSSRSTLIPFSVAIYSLAVHLFSSFLTIQLTHPNSILHFPITLDTPIITTSALSSMSRSDSTAAGSVPESLDRNPVQERPTTENREQSVLWSAQRVNPETFSREWIPFH